MQNDVLNVWKKTFSEHINEYNKFNIPPQLLQMASFFSPGQFYFYVMNFHNFEMEYVHHTTEEVLGVPAKEISMEKLLGRMVPEEIDMIRKKELVVADFVNNFMDPKELPFYKVVYFFTTLNAQGKDINMLHQAMAVTISDSETVEHVLGIHSDISHLSLQKHHNLSMIHINGGPSYFNLDPEKMAFDPTDCRPTGKFNRMFSGRETEILKLFSLGKTASQIAEDLFISENTVRTHRKKILEKSQNSNMTSLIAECLVEGIL